MLGLGKLVTTTRFDGPNHGDIAQKTVAGIIQACAERGVFPDGNRRRSTAHGEELRICYPHADLVARFHKDASFVVLYA